MAQFISSEDSNSPNKLSECVADKLRSDLGNLLKSEEFVDVTIHVMAEPGRSLLAHSSILAARSTVIAGLLRLKQQSVMYDLEIKSYSFEVISKMIKFMYTADTSNISQIAHELLQAAHEYDLLDLKSVCERKCLVRMNVGNAADFLCIAYMHDADVLKTKAMEYMKTHFEKVKETDGWAIIIHQEKYKPLLIELCEFFGSPEKKRKRASTSNNEAAQP